MSKASQSPKRPWMQKFYLKSTDADRRVLGVNSFPKGVWVEVPEGIWKELHNQPGWAGKKE